MKTYILLLFMAITSSVMAQSPTEQELLKTINKIAKKSVPRAASLVKGITFSVDGCTLTKHVTLRKKEDNWSFDYNLDTEDYAFDFYDAKGKLHDIEIDGKSLILAFKKKEDAEAFMDSLLLLRGLCKE